jgi:hypothetical protein
MHSIPTQGQFFMSLGDADKDNDVLAIGALLHDVHHEASPVLRAMALCEVFRYCANFWRRQTQAPRILHAPPTLPGTTTVPPGGTRGRSRALAPLHTVDSSSQSASFLRKRILANLETSVTQALCGIFDCSPNLLPNYIEERFDIKLTEHGVRTDNRTANLLRLNDAERALRKVSFRAGRAYMLQQRGDTVAEVPADTTSHTYSSRYPLRHLLHRLWCFGYVLTGDALYIEDHQVARETGGMFFHSSYLGGAPVLCAGDISFLDGRLTSISNLSGHYQPHQRNLVRLIQYLKRRHVKLDDVSVILFRKELGVALMNISAESPQNMFAKFGGGEWGDESISERTVPKFLASSNALMNSTPD